MALTIELSTAIAADRTSWTLTDDTVFGTGGNPARSAVGVFVSSSKMSYTNEATALTVTGSDPETDSSWVIEYTSDGWYRTYYVIIPDFDSSTTYAQYDAVFNPSDNKVYRSKANSNTTDTLTDTVWWEEITSPASLAANKGLSTESTNITSTVYHCVFKANADYTYSNYLSNQNPRELDDSDEALREAMVFAKMLDEVAVAHARSEVLEGELICRRIQSRFID